MSAGTHGVMFVSDKELIELRTAHADADEYDCMRRLVATIDALKAEAKKRAKVFAEVCEERDKAVASEKKNRTCHHFDRTPEGTRIAYFHDGQFVLNGDPEPSDNEETGHNCDAMGCSSVEHVIERVSLKRVAELETEVARLEGETPRWRDSHRILEAERDRLRAEVTKLRETNAWLAKEEEEEPERVGCAMCMGSGSRCSNCGRGAR